MNASYPRRPFAAPIPCRTLVGLALFCMTTAAFAADQPRIKTTTIPGGAGAGPLVKIEGARPGPVSNRYTAFDVADDTTFDLTGIHFAESPEHPMRRPMTIGDQCVPPRNIRIVGGVVDGTMPADWNWRLSHALGSSGFVTVATGVQILENARIHNVQDGWDPRETPSFKPRSYPNTGRFVMRGCYVTAIRDDAIENDEFLPGEIEDSLFDGVWTLYSEQNERRNGMRTPDIVTVGPNEDPTLRLTGVLVRLAVTNAREVGPGRWFKILPYGATSHRLVITDCVFATDAEPRLGWKLLDFPGDTTFHGRNFVLWLGQPGRYGAEIPKGVTFLEGQPAKDKWHQLRNEWLTAHGYDPRSPEDWNPLEAPVAAPRRESP